MIIKTFIIRDTSLLRKVGFGEIDDCGGIFRLKQSEKKVQKAVDDFLNENPDLTEVRRGTSISVAAGKNKDDYDEKVITDIIVTSYFDNKK